MKTPDIAYRRRVRALAEKNANAPPRGRLGTAIDFVKQHATIITLVGGTLAWLLLSGGDAYTKVQAAWDWWRIDHTLSGRWSNDAEGDLEPRPWQTMNRDDVLELELRVRGNSVEGEIQSPRTCKFFAWKMFEVEGVRKWWGLGGLHFWAWDFLEGRRTKFGEFHADYDSRTETLEVTLTEPTRLFPKTARLSKIPARAASDPTPPEDQGGYCPEHLQRMLDAVRALDAAAAAARRKEK